MTGPSGTLGFSNVTIPNALLEGPYSVSIGKSPPMTLSKTSNGTHTFLYFTYEQSTQNVKIIGTTSIPEFPFATLPLLFMILTSVTIIATKRALNKEHLDGCMRLARQVTSRATNRQIKK